MRCCGVVKHHRSLVVRHTASSRVICPGDCGAVVTDEQVFDYQAPERRADRRAVYDTELSLVRHILDVKDL